MIPRVVEVKPLPHYCLWVRFLDGTSGMVDLAQELWGPMFEPLANPEVFNGADLAPEFLYQMAQHAPSTMV